MAGSAFAKCRLPIDTTFPQFSADSQFSLLDVVSIPNEGEFPPSPVPEEAVEEIGALTRELFGEELQKVEVLPWNELISNKWQSLSRQGLSEDQRQTLLKRYAPPDTVAFLKAPKLNPECKAGLKNNAVVKRDFFNSLNQDQVGVALCALGEALSDFLKPSLQQSLSPEARSAVSKVNDSAKIIADLFYRLSVARRAQILPILNLVAKGTADQLQADEFLFGAAFGEEIKKATTIEKSSKGIVKAAPSLSRRALPVNMSAQANSSKPGNAQAPVRNPRQVNRRGTGAQTSSRRQTYRSRSHSRRR
ncbi:uncharacterized protein [Cardiocondyla obscurior]|uniref:uncharacterized protein n=1 Tax=Cardiocondyla obscurior TaxID=286306 RepID=UPI0039658A5F